MSLFNWRHKHNISGLITIIQSIQLKTYTYYTVGQKSILLFQILHVVPLKKMREVWKVTLRVRQNVKMSFFFNYISLYDFYRIYLFDGREKSIYFPQTIKNSVPYRPVTSLRSFSILHSLPVLIAVGTCIHLYTSLSSHTAKSTPWLRQSGWSR